MILSIILSFEKKNKNKLCAQIQSHPISSTNYILLTENFLLWSVYEREYKEGSWKLWVQTYIIDYSKLMVRKRLIILHPWNPVIQLQQSIHPYLSNHTIFHFSNLNTPNKKKKTHHSIQLNLYIFNCLITHTPDKKKTHHNHNWPYI